MSSAEYLQSLRELIDELNRFQASVVKVTSKTNELCREYHKQVSCELKEDAHNLLASLGEVYSCSACLNKSAGDILDFWEDEVSAEQGESE